MLCYRCGSYNADDARKCTVCSAPLSAPRRRAARAATGQRSTGRAPYEGGQLIGERYRVIDAVAQGTSGWVFRASDEREGGEVAVKVIAANLLQTDGERDQFAKALKAAKRIQHGNVVRILDDGRDRGQFFYVMPHLEGLTLRKIIDLRLEKNQTFSVSEILPLIAQIAQACDAWGRFAYHGAIRPGSVMVLPDVLKLTGVPHYQGLPRKPFVVFQEQAGSVHYLAPECRKEDAAVNRRADVYSIAVLFAEMLTGVVYGQDERSWKRAEASLPAPLLAVLSTALAESPEARFEGGQALFEALAGSAEAFDGLSAAASPEAGREEPKVELGPGKLPSAERPQKVISSRRRDDRLRRRGGGGVLAAAGVLLAAAVAVAGARWYSHRAILNSGEPPRRAALEASQNNRAETPETPETATETTSARNERRKTPEGRARAETRAVLDSKPKTQVEVSDSGPTKGRVQRHSAARPVPARSPRSDSKEDPREVAKRRAPTPATPTRSRESDEQEDSSTPPAVASLVPVRQPPPAPPTPPGPAKANGCPVGMVQIQRGRFLMGTQPNDPMRGFGDLQVRYRNTEAYCIDRYEFPNKKGVRPVTGVSWSKAKRACESVGKRLCSEVEWERACKGPSNSRFPFGNAFLAGACNVDNGGRLGATGAHAGCTSGYGVADMAGNAAEWTASRWSSEIPDRVVKGGGADQAMHASRCSARINEVASARGQQLGFRCCASLD